MYRDDVYQNSYLLSATLRTPSIYFHHDKSEEIISLRVIMSDRRDRNKKKDKNHISTNSIPNIFVKTQKSIFRETLNVTIFEQHNNIFIFHYIDKISSPLPKEQLCRMDICRMDKMQVFSDSLHMVKGLVFIGSLLHMSCDLGVYIMKILTQS